MSKEREKQGRDKEARQEKRDKKRKTRKEVLQTSDVAGRSGWRSRLSFVKRQEEYVQQIFNV